jgi:hypothetical protein
MYGTHAWHSAEVDMQLCDGYAAIEERTAAKLDCPERQICSENLPEAVVR